MVHLNIEFIKVYICIRISMHAYMLQVRALTAHFQYTNVTQSKITGSMTIFFRLLSFKMY